MADLISRQALLDDIKAAKEHGGMGAVVADTLTRYVKRQAPSADVTPVVRCKDCKHRGKMWGAFGIAYYCRNDKSGLTQMLDYENDFCSYGERRDDNAPD